MTTEGNGAWALNEKIDQLVREGTVRRIVVRNDEGRTILDLPIAVGLAAVLIAPMIAVAAAAVGLAGGWAIDVERVGEARADDTGEGTSPSTEDSSDSEVPKEQD